PGPVPGHRHAGRAEGAGVRRPAPGDRAARRLVASPAGPGPVDRRGGVAAGQGPGRGTGPRRGGGARRPRWPRRGGRAGAAEPGSALSRAAGGAAGGAPVNAVAIIAALTLREALRRKLIAALAVICLAMIGLSAWGFYRLSHTSGLTSGEIGGAVPEAFIL